MMNDPLELQTVVDFALEREEHLDAAVRLAKAFPTVQRQITAAVLDELETKLASNLGSDWKIHNCKDSVFVSRYAGFTVWGKAWGNRICLNLEYQRREEKTVLGIWRKEQKFKDATLDSALANAFVKKGLPGKRSRWWA